MNGDTPGESAVQAWERGALRCFLYPLAAVYAASDRDAEAFANAHGLRGRVATITAAQMRGEI